MTGAPDERDEDALPPPPPADWAKRTLKFWFDDHDRQDWFNRGDAFDAEVSERLGPWRDALRHHPVEHFLDDADTALAAIVLFDQAPRNIFRDSAEAFATDEHALAIAREAVAREFDNGRTVDERLFLYLPFEHSEDLDDQKEAVRLVSQLGDAEYTDYAQRHLEVIKRFGRFPHRNAVLGRADRRGEREAVAAGAAF